jgi:hypothetical protein
MRLDAMNALDDKSRGRIPALPPGAFEARVPTPVKRVKSFSQVRKACSNEMLDGSFRDLSMQRHQAGRIRDDGSRTPTSLTIASWELTAGHERTSITRACGKKLAPANRTWFTTVREHYSMAKDEQKKHESAEEKAASGKMKRKEFEKELAKLQVELLVSSWSLRVATRRARAA